MSLKPVTAGQQAKRCATRPSIFLIVCAFLLAACSTDAPKPAPKPHLPPQATTMCGDASPLNDADKKALCSVIETAHMVRWPEDRMATSVPGFRVMLFNAAQPITIIKVEMPAGAPAILTVRQLRGTKMIVNETKNIGADQRKQIFMLARYTALWTQGVNQDAPTAIGEGRTGFAACRQSHYVVAEAMQPGRYHLSLAHCAPMKRLEDFAMGVYNIAASNVPALMHELNTTVD